MPRLTNDQYLERRKILVWAWSDGALGFDNLKTFEQRDLHNYFAPDEPLSAAEALQYRKHVTQDSPGLASQAGRAYAKFEENLKVTLGRRRAAEESARTLNSLQRPRPHGRTGWRKGARRVVAMPIVRPKVDAYKLARVLVEIGLKEERNARSVE